MCRKLICLTRSDLECVCVCVCDGREEGVKYQVKLLKFTAQSDHQMLRLLRSELQMAWLFLIILRLSLPDLILMLE